MCNCSTYILPSMEQTCVRLAMNKLEFLRLICFVEVVEGNARAKEKALVHDRCGCDESRRRLALRCPISKRRQHVSSTPVRAHRNEKPRPEFHKVRSRCVAACEGLCLGGTTEPPRLDYSR